MQYYSLSKIHISEFTYELSRTLLQKCRTLQSRSLQASKSTLNHACLTFHHTASLRYLIKSKTNRPSNMIDHQQCSENDSHPKNTILPHRKATQTLTNESRYTAPFRFAPSTTTATGTVYSLNKRLMKIWLCPNKFFVCSHPFAPSCRYRPIVQRIKQRSRPELT